MLGRYMELYEGWQVDVSEWRLKNNYHRLTDARAGKFAKEKAGKIPAQKEKNVYEKQSCLFTTINITENNGDIVKRM